VIVFLNNKGISGLETRTPHFPELDYGNGYVATLIIDSVLRSVKDFWITTCLEDTNFAGMLRSLNQHFKNYNDFYHLQFPKRRRIVSPGPKVLEAVVQEFRKTCNYKMVGPRLEALRASREYLVACLSLCPDASSDDFLPLYCYCLMRACVPHFLATLHMIKVVSQRRSQEKWFLDCCVAVKHLKSLYESSSY